MNINHFKFVLMKLGIGIWITINLDSWMHFVFPQIQLLPISRPIRVAFADWEKNCKSLVSGGGSGGGGGRGGGGSKGGGGSGDGGDNGGGARQSPNPLQAFCTSSIPLRLETHFFQK